MSKCVRTGHPFVCGKNANKRVGDTLTSCPEFPCPDCERRSPGWAKVRPFTGQWSDGVIDGLKDDEETSLTGKQFRALIAAVRESVLWELQEALANQRRSLGAEHDKTIAELRQVRETAEQLIDEARKDERAAVVGEITAWLVGEGMKYVSFATPQHAMADEIRKRWGGGDEQ